MSSLFSWSFSIAFFSSSGFKPPSIAFLKLGQDVDPKFLQARQAAVDWFKNSCGVLVLYCADIWRIPLGGFVFLGFLRVKGDHILRLCVLFVGRCFGVVATVV